MSTPKSLTAKKAERLRKAAERFRAEKRKDQLFLWLVILLMVASTVAYFYFYGWKKLNSPRHQHSQQHGTNNPVKR